MEKILLPRAAGEYSPSHIPKIMIVDDDAAHLQFIKLILLREGFTCELILCDNPHQALEYLAEGPVDLVLLDVVMPEIDGFGMLERMKNHPAMADIPAIILTTTLETDYVVRAFAHGAVDYISKPINSAVLTARLGAVLQRKALEMELRLRNDQLERINWFKDELLSVCSHDLRAPLAAIEVICGSLDTALGNGGVAQAPGMVTKIINQSRLARRLVENLLNFNKIEEGMLLPSSGFFPAREFMQSVVENEQPLIQARGVSLGLQLPPEDLIVFGDRELLGQALRNVLGNAIKFAKTTISLAGAAEKMNPATGSRIRISVTDDGPGIPTGEAGEIFEKYSKGDQGSPGSGLGLYIARAAVSVHGGNISVASEPNRATTFTITLPNVYSRELLPDLSDQAEARVLVLSPVKHTAEQLEGVLLEAGMVNVTTDHSERPPPEKFQRPAPHLVLVNLESSTLNFIHLARFINEGREGTRWIFYGSETDLETVSRLITPAAPRLTSPLNPLVLLNLVARLLQEKPSKKATVSA